MFTSLNDIVIPDHIEKAIVTPHVEETTGKPPLWIMWKHEIDHDGVTDGPLIDSICTTEDSARYHYCAMVESFGTGRPGSKVHFYVERVPANHRFASSMAEVFVNSALMLVDVVNKRRGYRYKHEGD